MLHPFVLLVVAWVSCFSTIGTADAACQPQPNAEKPATNPTFDNGNFAVSDGGDQSSPSNFVEKPLSNPFIHNTQSASAKQSLLQYYWLPFPSTYGLTYRGPYRLGQTMPTGTYYKYAGSAYNRGGLPEWIHMKNSTQMGYRYAANEQSENETVGYGKVPPPKTNSPYQALETYNQAPVTNAAHNVQGSNQHMTWIILPPGTTLQWILLYDNKFVPREMKKNIYKENQELLKNPQLSSISGPKWIGFSSTGKIQYIVPYWTAQIL